MNESEYMKEARRLLAKVLNAARTDAILRHIKLLPIAEAALLSHIAKVEREVPVLSERQIAFHTGMSKSGAFTVQNVAGYADHIAKGERNYELIPPSAAEWFASCPAIANQDWRGGWDACRNRARALLDASVAKGEQARNAGVMVVPTEPVREAEIELADMQQNGDADDVLAAQINLEGVRHAARAKTADESGVPAPSYCDPGSGKPCMRPTTAGQQAGGGEDGKHCQVQVIHLTDQQREMLSAKGVTHIPGRADSAAGTGLSAAIDRTRAAGRCDLCKGTGIADLPDPWGGVTGTCPDCNGTGGPADADAPIPAEVVRRALKELRKAEAVYEANDIHPLTLENCRAAITELQQALEKTK